MSDYGGLVVARYGAEVVIHTESGEVLRAVARRKLDHIVCGDRIRWRPLPSGGATVVSIEPRRNVLERTYFRGKSRSVAANIDQVVIVFAAEPSPDWSLVDGLLLTAGRIGASALLLCNKADLPLPADALAMTAIYRDIGYQLLETTIHDSATLPPLADALRGQTSVLVGQSGTGKSTLLNRLIPDAQARTANLSDTTGFGQHTTSMAQRYRLACGGAVIDSPGIRDFTPIMPPAAEIQFGFVEFAKFSDRCRFNDCLHRNEPGCAVLSAVARGEISAARHTRYLDFLAAAEA